MRTQIYREKEFSILSKNVDNATKCVVTDVSDENFKVKLYTKEKYEQNESVELYSITDLGLLYFETIVQEIKDDVLILWYPITHKFLQRREYSRVNFSKDIVLKNDNNEDIMASIIDISAGGMKLASHDALTLSHFYDIEIEIEKSKFIRCKFEPIRIEAIKSGYIMSGRFTNLRNIERISLVQFCFKKQLEDQNK